MLCDRLARTHGGGKKRQQSTWIHFVHLGDTAGCDMERWLTFAHGARSHVPASHVVEWTARMQREMSRADCEQGAWSYTVDRFWPRILTQFFFVAQTAPALTNHRAARTPRTAFQFYSCLPLQLTPGHHGTPRDHHTRITDLIRREQQARGDQAGIRRDKSGREQGSNPRSPWRTTRPTLNRTSA